MTCERCKAKEIAIEAIEKLVEFNHFNQQISLDMVNNLAHVSSVMSLVDWQKAGDVARKRTQTIKEQDARIAELERELSMMRDACRQRPAPGYFGDAK